MSAEGDDDDCELVLPESDGEEDEDVLTVVDESVSTDALAREAANSMGVSRQEEPRSVRTVTTTGERNTKKRTATSGDQPSI